MRIANGRNSAMGRRVFVTPQTVAVYRARMRIAPYQQSVSITAIAHTNRVDAKLDLNRIVSTLLCAETPDNPLRTDSAVLIPRDIAVSVVKHSLPA